MNPRRGARALLFDLPHLGSTTVQVPRAAATGVVLLMHRGGTHTELAAISAGIPWHVLLVDVDVQRLRADASATCTEAAATVEDISRRAQRDAGLTAYQRPVIVATTGALPRATAAIAGSMTTALPAAVAVGGIAGDRTDACGHANDRSRGPDTAAARWGFASSAHTLASPLETALRAAATEPRRETTPVQRWLRHFDLPLTAAWSSSPRAMLVLLSPA
ncbi:MAG TPA: hypothetical protein VMF13_02745, partial [Luteitalea sp.]|nr:hypothetical protein [Luteitalea sp.]